MKDNVWIIKAVLLSLIFDPFRLSVFIIIPLCDKLTYKSTKEKNVQKIILF